MMYKAVRTYTLLPGSSEEFLRRVQEGFVPLMSQEVGFISYNARSLGIDQVITISTFDTRNGAEESMLRALLWIQENCGELLQGLPGLTMSQVFTTQTSREAPQVSHGHMEKTLVLDLNYVILHPSALGAQAYTDPDINRMVMAIGTVLTQMKADPVGRDRVYARFGHEVLPEVVTTSLYTADHVILITRGGQLAGYAEINRETNAWQSRERFEGDIIVDLAAYHRNAGGDIVEKGIGEQSLLEMRRQAMLLGVTAIELDVYRSNQPMHRFLDHLIATHRLPFTKHEMTYGERLDSTYLLSCEGASVDKPTSSASGSANR